MEILNKDKDQITIKAKIDESLANAIRRYVNQVQILPVDEVEISKNDSPLYDETIAHRIGLIPLEMNKNFNDKDMPKLKLESKKSGYVYSEEIHGDAKAVYKKIPITSLNEDQELIITATTKLGRGIDHAKFSPGMIYYRNFADIKIPKDCLKEVVSFCPKKILKIKDEKVIAEHLEDCDLCEACVDFCKKQGKGIIELEPLNDLKITIESFGQIETKEIFNKSIETLKKDLLHISKNLK
jgi:DNA-directed RNA polymerase subunit D